MIYNAIMLTITETPKLVHGIWEHAVIDDADRMRAYKYIECARSNHGEVKLELSKKRIKNVYVGRYFTPEWSTASMPKAVRAILFEGFTEIDMCSSAPSIALAVLSQGFCNDEKCIDILRKYINNRADIIAELNIKRSPEDAQRLGKQLFLRLLCGGSRYQWEHENKITAADYTFTEFLREFAMATDDIRTLVCRQYEHHHVLRGAFEKEDRAQATETITRRVFAHVIQEHESAIVGQLLDFIRTDTSAEIGGYIYDGILVRASEIDLIRIMAHANNGIKSRDFVAQNIIRFAQKPLPAPSLDWAAAINARMVPLCPYIAEICDRTLIDVLRANAREIHTADGEYWVHDGARWVTAELSDISADMMRTLVPSLIAEITLRDSSKDGGKRASLFMSTSRNIRSAMKDVASGVGTHADFDRNPLILNALNGTYDLISGTLRAHSAADMCSLVLPHEIDPALISQETFDQCASAISSWFTDRGDNALATAKWLISTFGARLRGDMREQKAIILMSRLSRNGKSSWVHIMRAALGEYTCSLPIEIFRDNVGSEAPRPALLGVLGRRIAFVDEADASENPIQCALFKTMTGADALAARTLYSRKIVQFRNQASLIFITNTNLRFTDSQAAIANRLQYVPFGMWFGDESQPGWTETRADCRRADPNFIDRIDARLMLHAMLYALAHPVQAIAEIRADGNDLIHELDPVSAWAHRFIVYDASKFGENEENDADLMRHCAGLRGKPRVITNRFMFKRFIADMKDIARVDDIKISTFGARMAVIFPDSYRKLMRTTLFGASKLICMKDLRYLGFDGVSHSDFE